MQNSYFKQLLAMSHIQAMLDFNFNNISLLAEALTHSSLANEQTCKHNERLEFLGDAVLELAISRELFDRFPKAREGQLTRMRASLINAKALATIGREIGVDKALMVGHGDEKMEIYKLDSVVSDALEAVLAAVYLEGGFAESQKVIRKLFASHWPATPDKPVGRDAKNRLQTLFLNMYKVRPVYRLIGSSGPDHARIYEVAVELPDGSEFRAKNTSCKKAEQDAAALALEKLSSMTSQDGSQ